MIILLFIELTSISYIIYFIGLTCSPPCQNCGNCTEANICVCPAGFIGSDCSEEG